MSEPESDTATFGKLRAFILGVREFRTDFTMSFDDYELMQAYDFGRDLAHRLTLRRFDV